MVRRFFICIVIIITLSFLLSISVLGKEEHVPLLAIQTNGINETGSIADLGLEITNGEGKIFIDSFPLTKVDTQMSTRFSTLLACKIAEKDCSNYNFYYTIRADSSIIGGPSASGIIAVLASALLSGDKIKTNISMTGTVNSGNILGPVGGYKAKIDAASLNGIHTVIIPKGEAISTKKDLNIFLDNETNFQDNITLNLIEYGKSLNITVIEASTIYEALEIFTGKSYSIKSYKPTVDESYTKIMKELASLLCERNDYLIRLINSYNSSLEWYNESRVHNFSVLGNQAFSEERYYSSASYCFGANIQLRSRLLEEWKPDNETIKGYLKRVENEIINFEDNLDKKKLNTITDLQTYMVVKERIHEAKQSIIKAYEEINSGKEPLYSIAYAEERIYSAEAWSFFFESSSPIYDFGSNSLKQSCMNKLTEADETFRYMQIYFPTILSDSRESYEKAYSDYINEDYALCLFRASKSKAQSSVLLSVMGRDENTIQNLLDIKIDVVRNEIARFSEENYFPIVGYSYYEYAISLRDSDPYSSLLYLEYALEIGNLDLYFQTAKKSYDMRFIGKKNIHFMIVGFFLGCIIMYVIMVLIIMKKTQQNTHDECLAGKKR